MIVDNMFITVNQSYLVTVYDGFLIIAAVAQGTKIFSDAVT